MKLARIFRDYMVLQRNVPIILWGTADAEEKVEVTLNGSKIAETEVQPGEFVLTLPPQRAMEDATLCVGNKVISHVDIGEVWIAGGQSNMEFFLKYDEQGKDEIANAGDEHLRMYTVGRYSFDGDREDGIKAWNPWDEWIPYVAGNAIEEFSAAGVYFAKELRKAGVPVGIINCSWGGTTASTWLDKSILEKDEVLHEYLDDYDAIVAALDLKRYEIIRKYSRPIRFGKPADGIPDSRDVIFETTYYPSELQTIMAGIMGGSADSDTPNPLAPLEEIVGGPIDFAETMAPGPGYENEPGALFEHMVKEIIGYSVKGVIWYQGCSDETHPADYERLFTAMIQCWRKEWMAKNSNQERLPFIFVQLAPFGMWMTENGDQFPELRKQQEATSKDVEDTYMISITDIGNVFDIHPKNKRDVGERLSRMALKYVYQGTELEQKNIIADAPEAETLTVEGNKITVGFANGEGLYLKKTDFVSYNGFPVDTIPEKFLPPIVDGINALEVSVNGNEIAAEHLRCSIENNNLKIQVEDDDTKIASGDKVMVKLARRGFYQVNLYNSGNLPVKPFEICN